MFFANLHNSHNSRAGLDAEKNFYQGNICSKYSPFFELSPFCRVVCYAVFSGFVRPARIFCGAKVAGRNIWQLAKSDKTLK